MLVITSARKNAYARTNTLSKSRWTLTNDEIVEDIAIETYEDGSKDVRISGSAFTNASPKIVEIEGRRGIWFSQRLHHAIVRFVTDFGTDSQAAWRLLEDRFEINNNVDFNRLTAQTTGETASSFQAFEPDEIVHLINIMEEMPKGFHKIPGLRHIVRRINGTPHPIYPKAAAVAWPDHGYIEFMESAFAQSSIHDIHRLILHEKAHFIWAHMLDEHTKQDWIELGEWYEDPDSPSGWSTKQTTQFVSAYAHGVNPNEDMAESVADFIVNPSILTARAPLKYEFIRDRIMAGDYYISKIREDLTFEVYNLYPDYVYPGKLRKVNVRVSGTPQEDKVIHAEVELHALGSTSESAASVLMRVHSSIGTYFGFWLGAVDIDGNQVEEGIRLEGSQKLSRFAKAGYWHPGSVILVDRAGNARYQTLNTFEMKIYIDNQLEDYFEPEYVAESIKLTKSVETRKIWDIDREIQTVHISWIAEESNELRTCWAGIEIENGSTGVGHYGTWDVDLSQCNVELDLPHYMASGVYEVRRIAMKDAANNWGDHVFLSDGSERIPSIEVITNNPDHRPPEIDVNRIYVDAEPINASAPDGETRVNLRFRVRDDNSGVLNLGVNLRDPQGGTHYYGLNVDDSASLFSKVPPNKWQDLTRIVILPVGSPPGTWGVSSMYSRDRADNSKWYDFVETVHIDVENMAAVLHFDTSDQALLCLDVSSTDLCMYESRAHRDRFQPLVNLKNPKGHK